MAPIVAQSLDDFYFTLDIKPLNDKNYDDYYVETKEGRGEDPISLLVKRFKIQKNKDLKILFAGFRAEHVPELLKVPGVLSVRRAVTVPLTMSIGGEKKTIVAEGEPRYSAYYELESAEVLVSDAWATAVEKGRWPAQVRPYTRNRRHVLRKLS